MEKNTCPKCGGTSVKNGKIDGRQRFRCTECRSHYMGEYIYKGHKSHINSSVISLLREGCGIRSIGRLLEISPTTVQKRILLIASTIKKPAFSFGKEYEMDELCTFIGRKDKQFWVAYAMRRDTKEVVDFRIGRRNNKTLMPLVQTLHLTEATRIFTDKLSNYRYIVDPSVHSVKRFGTNGIERMNLTLRTHLKRLNRRSICFSRSWQMLQATLTIYFWEGRFMPRVRERLRLSWLQRWRIVVESPQCRARGLETDSPAPPG